MIAKKAGRFACALLAVMVSVVAGGSLVPAQTLVSIGVFTNGDNNFSSLIQGRDGAFYGTSLVGASRNDGSVFKVTTSGTITTLHSFCSQSNCVDGYLPYGPLVLGTDGYFYGVAAGGTANMGVIYRISSTGSYKVIHSFLGSDGHGPDGLVWASDGNLYGVTTIGGSLGYGTIFKATTSGVVTTLHNFDFTHGSDPSAAMAQGSDNNFYGTTAQGGTDNSCLGQPCGIVFKMTPSGSFTVLHNFNVNQGFDTFAPVVQAANGTFYGLTQLGGLVNASCPNGCGTLYSITSNGTFQIVHKFQHSDGGNSPAH